MFPPNYIPKLFVAFGVRANPHVEGALNVVLTSGLPRIENCGLYIHANEVEQLLKDQETATLKRFNVMLKDGIAKTTLNKLSAKLGLPIEIKEENPKLRFDGFEGWLLNEYGHFTTPLGAMERGNDVAVMGFMLPDGRTLGAPAHLESVCFELYKNRWTHFIRMPDTHWRPISEYKA